MAADLRFISPPDATPPYDLLFGVEAQSSQDAALTFSTTLPAPSLGAVLQYVEVKYLAFAATLPAPTMAASLDHDNAVFRGVQNGPRAAWQEGDDARVRVDSAMGIGAPLPAFGLSAWQACDRLGADFANTIESGEPVRSDAFAPWADCIRLGAAQAGDSFGDMPRLRNGLRAGWDGGIFAEGVQFSSWQDRIRAPRPQQVSRWGDGIALTTKRLAGFGIGSPRALLRQSPWGESIRPLPGTYSLPPEPPPGEGCYTPPDGDDVELLFRFARDGLADLLFLCSRTDNLPATVIVPVQRCYIMINDVRLFRVDGSIELPVLAFQLQIDMDSWTWSFSASLPASELANVEPATFGDPVELEAIINGQHYMLLAESIQRDRQFAKARIAVGGRGHSAILASPYSPLLTFGNTAQRTAQQLMNDALTTNGVSLGWSVDWGITDWAVPAGVFSHQGSYMDAVTRIASAAGAFILPHPTAQTLRVRPRHPAPHWQWGALAPDIELPAAAVEREGITWADKPAYNAVYVSGTTADGVLALVKRTGTAGDVIAPMVTEALITHADAARQRGAHVLSDTGRSATASLTMPILAETGIIEPGKLIRYLDGAVARVGVSRAVSVDFSKSPALRQTIEVETYA